MTSIRRLASFILLLAIVFVPATLLRADTDENGFVRVLPEDIEWKDAPGYNGVKMAVIAGDPSKPGVYVVRVKFPPGIMSRPHFHPDDRYAIVIKGTWWTGTGDTFDPSTTVPVKAGGFMKHPAGGHHYDGAKDEEVILQLIGYGPGGTTMIHPEDGHTGPSR
ncbi:MAG TPA: cupin domain-containing protein [Burkholderiales bacterium]